MLIGAFVIGITLALIGIVIINRAESPDASSLGFGIFGIGALFVVITIIASLFMIPVHGRDLGQWDNQDPAIKQWYESLMQPDVPTASCCGEADAYWCDDVHVRDNRTFCKITDDRPDGPRMRPHIDVGTEYEIPPNKLKWDKANPTGHFIVFLSRGGYVYCFVQGGGV